MCLVTVMVCWFGHGASVGGTQAPGLPERYKYNPESKQNREA